MNALQKVSSALKQVQQSFQQANENYDQAITGIINTLEEIAVDPHVRNALI